MVKLKVGGRAGFLLGGHRGNACFDILVVHYFLVYILFPLSSK